MIAHCASRHRTEPIQPAQNAPSDSAESAILRVSDSPLLGCWRATALLHGKGSRTADDLGWEAVTVIVGWPVPRASLRHQRLNLPVPKRRRGVLCRNGCFENQRWPVASPLPCVRGLSLDFPGINQLTTNPRPMLTKTAAGAMY